MAAEVAPRREGQVGAAHDLVGEVPAALHAQAPGGGGAVGPGVEGAVGPHGHGQAQGFERGNEVVAAGLELGAAAFVLGDAVRLEAGQRGMLRHGARTDEEVLCQPLHDRDHGLGHDHPAQAPARHVEVFAEAVDADDVLADRERRVPEGLLVGEAEVDLVDEGEAVACLHGGVDAAQFIGRDRGARGVGGRRQQHAARLRAPMRGDLVGAELEALPGGGGHEHRAAVRRAHEMAVARVARVRHEYLVALLDERQAGELQGAGGTRRDHDAARRHRHAEALGVPAADALAQRVQAEGVGVLRGAAAQGAVGRFAHQRRGGEVGLADVQEDHRLRAAGHLAGQGLRGLGDLHHVKGFDALGAPGKLHGRGVRRGLGRRAAPGEVGAAAGGRAKEVGARPGLSPCGPLRRRARGRRRPRPPGAWAPGR